MAAKAPNRSSTRKRWFSLGITRRFLVLGMQVSDILSFIFGAYLAHVVRFNTAAPDRVELTAISLSVVIAILAFPAMQAASYLALQNPWHGLKRATRAFVAVFAILALLAFGLQVTGEFSRIWVTVWILSAYFSLVCTRIWWSGFLKHGIAVGFLRERLALIHGRGTRHVEEIALHLREKGYDIETVVPLHTPPPGVPERRPVPQTPGRRYASLDDFVHRFGTEVVDRAILIPDPADERPLRQVAAPLRMIPLDVDVIPSGYDSALNGRMPRLAGGIPVVTLMTRPLSDSQVLIKRLEDLVLGTGLLIAAAPLMALIAVLVKLDSPGPVLFAQSRAGFNNVPFKIYKFRSMVVHDDAKVKQATRDDNRITRVGRILRRTSLDELPQLFNVVLGSMSLVGPRPHALAHDQEYGALIDTYIGRHRMKPGLTGWAQVNGWRGETDTLDKMLKRIEHDLYYVDGWSLYFDLKILIMTARVLYHRNAY
ncbi:undecaprenyl-phosphate glucose phosphotransferase [Roseospira navarrensis]|uniref:Undecaprenyl-phosphate glucose phosphotransferase n=1 Tax=Roseospira navarrensis TaxID=140058 RepID=A0A7X2D300_9PROT|nr:undecaprenyl-phosphate glucose phosphotransferase [Roseospira navarrensis]MQX36789.1 undecaprenyl-phosphate glucose phosphotransferase [Roseospira navarrensis]